MSKLEKFFVENHLTDREIDVASLIVKGLSNKEVAATLFVTDKTIKFHLTHIYKKMNVKSRAQLTALSFPHMDVVQPQKFEQEPEKELVKPATKLQGEAISCSGPELPVGSGYKV